MEKCDDKLIIMWWHFDLDCCNDTSGCWKCKIHLLFFLLHCRQEVFSYLVTPIMSIVYLCPCGCKTIWQETRFGYRLGKFWYFWHGAVVEGCARYLLALSTVTWTLTLENVFVLPVWILVVNFHIVSLQFFLWGHLCSSQLFPEHAVGCAYLFSASYLTRLSFPQWTANSEALLLVSAFGFAGKGPSVSRISTLLSKATVFDPWWYWVLKLCILTWLLALLLASRRLCFLGVKSFFPYCTCWDNVNVNVELEIPHLLSEQRLIEMEITVNSIAIFVFTVNVQRLHTVI